MVNSDENRGGPRRSKTGDGDVGSLTLAFVPWRQRPAVSALLALDSRLGGIVRTTREPLLGQMRLAWWRDALTALDRHRAPDEPLLQAVQRDLLPCGATGAALAELTGAWEALLVAEQLDEAVIAGHGLDRGARLFTLIGQILGEPPSSLAPPAREAGRGWAMADLAGRWSRPSEAGLARAMAIAHLDHALAGRWPRRQRPLGVMALLARIDLETEEGRFKPLSRFARLLRLSLTGR